MQPTAHATIPSVTDHEADAELRRRWRAAFTRDATDADRAASPP
jgi:hypothetical protein